jgi:hypothetical protein
MSISHDQALAALKDAEQTTALSSTLHGYQQSSPHLILWGLVWAVAYALSNFLPSYTGIIWLLLDSLGVMGSLIITRKNSFHAKNSNHWRVAAVTLTIIGFVLATFAILPPDSGKQIAVFIPLLVATAYVLIGIWKGLRLVLIGIAVAALSLFGFFCIDAYFNLWMAFVGGGALVLAGIWLRRI